MQQIVSNTGADSCGAGPSPHLPGNERDQALMQFNRTQTEYPSGMCVHSLFEAQVENHPERVAVVCGSEELTYAELNLRANRIAKHLLSLGVSPDSFVAVFMKRSPALIISILGVLKAGGAYLPLDINYPRERLAMMLEDAGPQLVLTESALVKSLPVSDSKVVCIDKVPTSDGDVPNPNCPTTADNRAYVMFTSGSTGRPNGVMVEHRSIVRLVKGTNYADFSADNVFLQFAPTTFDASTFEIWGALLNGARLAIMPEGVPSLAELGQAIRQYQVTTLWLTAGLFHLMVDERIEDLKPLRQLLAGGDVLSVPHVQKVLNTLDCDLINGYGPTENTTFTCCYRIPRDTQLGSSVPIGSPIANTQVYILDVNLDPVPHGEIGELYIGGDGLARGYLNRDNLTAERFIVSPFPRISSARLYRSGDLARFLPDGNIEFLGRADSQVKIRGFRIELEEIEVALTRYSGVREAVVIARVTSATEKQLVAFIVCEQDSGLEVCALRSYLESKLPKYMIPAFIFSLDQMPLNPNGKVDRQELLKTIPTKSDCTSLSVDPETEPEAKVSAIFRDVLHLEQIGTTDNFFDLGANSLQLARAHHRLQEVFGSDLRIIALFQNPTVKTLAEFLSGSHVKALTNTSHDRGLRQRDAFARQKQIHQGIR